MGVKLKKNGLIKLKLFFILKCLNDDLLISKIIVKDNINIA